ncbi:extracellular cell wall glucanase Crf1 [Lophium mytilinum]|uniref:chitinase n=1 Tax=Lophium mytilinum TaxID=390894 RepID=A0A6A6QSM7_9PEZI|nr:extracellular cell wall glucanase Crf1 [Lophium mytilinum]
MLYLALVAALLPAAFAQTWTACNPLNSTGCPTNPALGGNATFLWNTTSADSNVWNTTNGKVQYTPAGGEFTINERHDSPTIQSKFYIFFGVVSVIMRAAPGQGVISSIVLESDDLDEVDWEFIGGNHTHVETNYFGKGNTTSYDRAIYYPVDKPQDQFHNYTVHWTKDAIEWWIDDNSVRTLKYGDALGGKNFPQTPMNIRLGIWAGGDPDNSNGTIEWAGGLTNYGKGPYTMTVAEIYAQDFTSGKEYAYGDKTGDWESIKITEGQSKAIKEITSPHGVTGRWKALSKTTQIAIAASAAGAAVLCLLAILFCCIKQRRAGRREYAELEAQREKEAAELVEYKTKMANGGFGHGSHNNW